MLQNVRVTALTVSELLRENQRETLTLTPPPPPPPPTHTHTPTPTLGLKYFKLKSLVLFLQKS